MNRNALKTVGLARRAGRLVLGLENLEKTRKTELILLAADASERTRRAVFRRNEPTVETDLTKAEIGHAVGCSEAAVVALTDAGFARSVRRELEQQEDNE